MIEKIVPEEDIHQILLNKKKYLDENDLNYDRYYFVLNCDDMRRISASFNDIQYLYGLKCIISEGVSEPMLVRKCQ